MADRIAYRLDAPLKPEQVADLFRSSGIRRPAEDLDRIRAMIEHANLTVTAWDDGVLVGIARALTDFRYCCYLSDLAVRREYQGSGIGRELLRRLRERLCEESLVLLLSAPEAADYYPKLGFEKADNAWIIHRRR